MRTPRVTITGLMIVVALTAILLAVFRTSSYWGLLGLLPFGIAALVARAGSTPRKRRTLLGVGIVATLLLPFLAAIWLNHNEWGYYVSRPAVDRRIAEASRIETITHVETRTGADGGRSFSGEPVAELEKYGPKESIGDDYYVLDARVLHELKSRRSLPKSAPAMAPGRLAALYRRLGDTGLLEEGEGRYTKAKDLDGIVVEARGRDGRPLLFVGARGHEVSNDHYPYYEFLFSGNSPGGPLELISFQRFYYDVAGIEGMEWPMFLTPLAILCLFPTLILQGVLIWRDRRGR